MAPGTSRASFGLPPPACVFFRAPAAFRFAEIARRSTRETLDVFVQPAERTLLDACAEEMRAVIGGAG